MSEHKITVEGGSSVRLPTSGKYCDRDIIVTAEGGGTELPPLDYPAAESDVVKGKEYIDASGAKKTGTVEEVDGQVIMDEFIDFTYDGEVFAAVGLFGEDKLVRAGSVGVVFVSPEWLGDATQEDVVAGKTFTSAAGTKLPGTVKESTDGMGIEAYGDLEWADVTGMGEDPVIANSFDEDVLIRKGHKILVPFNYTGFGTATPEDVAKGKTFTCETGVLRVGTNESSGMETAMVDVQTWAGFGVFMYWMSPEGLMNEALPSGRYEVVKNSLLVAIYEGSTYLKTHDVLGGEVVYTNAGATGYTCTILTFYDDECSVIFEEA